MTEPAQQGKGIGAYVIAVLESTYADQVDLVELGVHESNQRAAELYKRSGFQVARSLPALGFSIMQKPLGKA